MFLEIFKKYKSGFSLIFNIAFCFISMFSQAKFIVSGTKSAIRVLDFFTETLHTVGTDITELIDSYRSYQTLKTERDALRKEMEQTKNLRLRIAQLESENFGLRNQLGLSLPKDYPYIPAEVISQDPDNWFRTIIINKGTEDGILPYMPVIAVQTKNPIKKIQNNFEENELTESDLNQGVIGKVIQVSKSSARILPLVDKYSRIGIQIEKSGFWALLIGRNPYHKNPILEYLSLNSVIEKGDQIVTSGGDGIFPKGLPIGRVGDFIERGANFQKAEIVPLIDLHRLEYVFVIKKELKEMEQKFKPLTAENIESP
ncbi:MAG: rod shape-determining protein MreC [Spirochaetia bacterium]|nr:rod shape-determining protein MreC [Spirochaetia bacterium]